MTAGLFWSTAVVAVLAAWRRLAPPETFLPPSPLAADMIFVPSGPPRDGAPQGFFIDRFETTRAEFAAFAVARGAWALDVDSRTSAPEPPGDIPVSKVTWREAADYARRRGKRLPSAAEWDLAARSPGGMRFPWGDGFVAACANTLELGVLEPVRVGTFENGRTAAGVYDLFGNVAEWTATAEAGGFGVRRLILGSSFFSRGAAVAPVGGLQPRRGAAEDSFSFDVGFRCVADAADAEADRDLRSAVARLAVRDPAGIVLQRLPAERKLRAGGARARALLEETVRRNAADPGASRIVARCRTLLAEGP
jgi:hypothetical protein